MPGHWVKIRAKNIFTKQNRAICEQDDVVTCFRDGTVTLRKNRRISGFTESTQWSGYQGVRKGDLVIHVMDAFAGAIGVSDSNGKSTPVYSVCTAKIDVNNHYYAYLLREMARSGFIQSLYRGIRERSSDFRFEVFAGLYLPLPPRDEQDQIVRFLDWKVSQINKLINAKRRQVELLREKRRVMISSQLRGELVWLKRLLISPFQYGANDSGVEFSPTLPRYIRITDISLGGNLKNDGLKSLTNKIAEPYLLADGDILFARSGATAGKTFLYKSKYGICGFAGYLIRAKIDKNKILPEYLMYITNGADYEQWKNSVFIQATIQNISAERYGQLPVPLPSLAEQHKIVAHLDEQCENTDRLIGKFNDEITLFTEYRIRLISDVVTGKTDICDVSIPEYEYMKDNIGDENINEEMEDVE
jgi:type I restriction enzyme S subunit